ncbi:hypothetical protein V8D89_008871 [Ganoderma adspersum]
MYPGPINSPLNHSHGICSDEVWQSARVKKEKTNGKVILGLEDPLPFLQPEKLFTTDKDGHYFHVDRLLKLLSDFYIHVISGVAGSGPGAMYDITFAQLLQDRVKVVEASPANSKVVLFKLYRNIKIVDIGERQTYSYGGEEWIHLNNANNTPFMFGNDSPESSAQPSQAGPSDVGSSHAATSPSRPSCSSRASSSGPDLSLHEVSSGGMSSMPQASSPQLGTSQSP